MATYGAFDYNNLKVMDFKLYNIMIKILEQKTTEGDNG